MIRDPETTEKEGVLDKLVADMSDVIDRKIDILDPLKLTKFIVKVKTYDMKPDTINFLSSELVEILHDLMKYKKRFESGEREDLPAPIDFAATFGGRHD